MHLPNFCFTFRVHCTLYMPCLQYEEKKNPNRKKKQMPQKDNAIMHAAKGNDEKEKLGGICYCRQTLQVI